MEEFEKRFIDHMDRDDQMFDHISASIDKIRDNHLAHIQESMGRLQIDSSSLTSDVAWLKKFFWVIATASMGSLITVIVGVFFRLASRT